MPACCRTMRMPGRARSPGCSPRSARWSRRSSSAECRHALRSATRPGTRSACRCSTIAFAPGWEELSRRLGDADWLDGAFSAGDLLMVTVLRRLNGSGTGRLSEPLRLCRPRRSAARLQARLRRSTGGLHRRLEQLTGLKKGRRSRAGPSWIPAQRARRRTGMAVLANYQIFTRSAGATYILSPGLTSEGGVPGVDIGQHHIDAGHVRRVGVAETTCCFRASSRILLRYTGRSRGRSAGRRSGRRSPGRACREAGMVGVEATRMPPRSPMFSPMVSAPLTWSPGRFRGSNIVLAMSALASSNGGLVGRPVHQSSRLPSPSYWRPGRRSRGRSRGRSPRRCRRSSARRRPSGRRTAAAGWRPGTRSRWCSGL
jgi:hypothetical protein